MKAEHLPFGERRAHPRYQPTKDLIATAKKVELGRCEECEHTEFCQSCGFDGPSCICQPKLSPHPVIEDAPDKCLYCGRPLNDAAKLLGDFYCSHMCEIESGGQR